MRRLIASLALSWTLLPGCSSSPEQASSAPVEAVAVGSRFNQAATGRIEGQVLWRGPVPKLPDFLAPLSPRAEGGLPGKRFSFPNPRAPQVSEGRFVTSAVVYLQGIDPARSRPWDLPPVHVEIQEQRMAIHQGDVVSSCGFVQRGHEIEMVSRDPWFHTIQLRGASFCTVPLVDANVVRKRQLSRTGVVQLGSASGSFWMGCHLFVDEHPYYVRTDEHGKFSLKDVPSGSYEVVAWLPDWHESSRELDGDTWEIASIKYGPPVQVRQTVQVRAGQTCQVELTFQSQPGK